VFIRLFAGYWPTVYFVAIELEKKLLKNSPNQQLLLIIAMVMNIAMASIGIKKNIYFKQCQFLVKLIWIDLLN